MRLRYESCETENFTNQELAESFGSAFSWNERRI